MLSSEETEVYARRKIDVETVRYPHHSLKYDEDGNNNQEKIKKQSLYQNSKKFRYRLCFYFRTMMLLLS